MHIYTAKDLQAAEKEAIKKEGITSIALMEQVASEVYGVVSELVGHANSKVKVFCGTGNNGGDGLAISRMLVEDGVEVEVYVVNLSNKRSDDFLVQYDLFKSQTGKWPVVLNEQDDLPVIEFREIVVDAIFGIGLNRPVGPWVGRLIRHINDAYGYTVSIDVPSGMFVDKPTPKDAPVVMAQLTLTVHFPKLPFFFPETGKTVGNFLIADIDLDPDVFKRYEPVATYVNELFASDLYQPRPRFSHKGTFGHALLIGGSYGKMGSISLSTSACLRAGAGMVSAYIPQCGASILQTSIPEAMIITGNGQQYIEDIKYDFEPAAICFGPGAGTGPKTAEAFREMIEKATTALVIDADGLNLLVENPDLLEMLPEGTILTPHPKELERLIGSWDNDFEKLEKAWNLSTAYNLILVLKDAYTFIIFNGQVYVNSSGNAGMATAGSGDVLAGVITGLLAQGYLPEVAAVLGVYLHGRAGDIAAQIHSPEAMIAGDLVASLGKVYKELSSPFGVGEDEEEYEDEDDWEL